MDMRLEVVVVPVSDVDRAKAFYTEKAGFNVDVDRSFDDRYRVVQLTPPSSACSITLMQGMDPGMEPGSLQGSRSRPSVGGASRVRSMLLMR